MNQRTLLEDSRFSAGQSRAGEATGNKTAIRSMGSTLKSRTTVVVLILDINLMRRTGRKGRKRRWSKEELTEILPRLIALRWGKGARGLVISNSSRRAEGMIG